jgi:hypothetical protein
MPLTASALFQFIDSHPVCIVERREFDMPEFGVIRRCIRQIVMLLRESGEPDAVELSDGLRHILSGWLTAPIEFDESIHRQLIDVLGAEDQVGARWGRDIFRLHAAAVKASIDLVGKENPIRDALRQIIVQAAKGSEKFRVLCQKGAASYFIPIVGEGAFIHSGAGYRDAPLFDLLIKVGPLRSHGWGCSPDAILSAPRFSRLVQLVWAGCADEEGFGYDPATALDSLGQKGIRVSKQNLTVTISRIGDSDLFIPDMGDSTDEFRLFASLKERSELRPATLVQIEDDSGMLFPPFSRVIRYDPDPNEREPIAKRLVEENLSEGMFLVRPAAIGAGETEIHAEHGYFSRIWKARLRQELDQDASAFCLKILAAGINLEHLQGAARHWAKTPTTVIHAPQKRAHFEILIRELNIEPAFPVATRSRGREVWWQRAWLEIALSRGAAIQAGVHVHEAFEDDLIDSLRAIIVDIRERAATEAGSFSITIPDGARSGCLVFFDRIIAIERGFRAAENELRVVHPIGSFEQWRV